MQGLKIVGRRVPKKDAEAKATGKAKYVADIRAENMKYGAVVRSPHHHALVTGIDAKKATQLEGVVAILTAKDIPGLNAFGVIINDQPVLVADKVRHQGEAVALVIAEREEIARRAVEQIKVSYEPLPAVFDPVQALGSDSPHLHPEGNLLDHRQICQGEIEKGFAQADAVVEETFHVPIVDHAYLEPETALAQWQPDGSLIIWASSQYPFRDQAQICASLALPKEKVRVINAAIGGAFGGKDDVTLQILAGLAAWAIKGSVRMVNSREESMLAHSKRHAAELRYKVAADKKGQLVALRAKIFANTGAYASLGVPVHGLMVEMASGPYRIPNIAIDGYLAYTNCPPAGAMRGFGVPQSNFALESCIDMLAAKLGCDPLELRLKNIWRKGDRTSTGVLLKSDVGMEACLLEAKKQRARLQEKGGEDPKRYGVGLAAGVMSIGLGYGLPDDSSNEIEWLPDGRALVRLGAPDMGQGLATVAAQIAAEALDLPYDRVEVMEPDTFLTPNGGASSASRKTYMVGNSLLFAAKEAVSALLSEASMVLKLPPEDLVYRKGMVHRGDDPRVQISSQELAKRAAVEHRTIKGLGKFSFPYPQDTPKEFGVGMPHVIFCYGAQVAAVEIDPGLGTVDVKELVAIHDVGRLISPLGAEGQVEGSVSMGVGYALYEEMRLKEDGSWVEGFTEYLLPTSMDMPRVKTIILEFPEPSGPFGAKGIGEPAIVPTAAAIANAIYDARGVRITSLPVRPEMLLEG